jgi:hypothetical protein
VLAAVDTQFPGDVAKRDEMVKSNPYTPENNICKYCVVVARLTVKEGIHISDKKSHFTHSGSCPDVGKVTSKMLLLREKSFVATVSNFGGKASEKIMRAEAAKLGFGAMLHRRQSFGA